MNALTPAHLSLIDALAELAAQDYLREIASNDIGSSDDRSERVLPRLDEAA